MPKTKRDINIPKISPENQRWFRMGKLNEKHHIDMTEEEKANIALCTGTKHTHPCKNPMFRCTVCGNYGCSQVEADKCTDQAFKNDKCLQCGAQGDRVPLMKDEVDEYVAKWNEEVPEIKELEKEKE